MNLKTQFNIEITVVSLTQVPLISGIFYFEWNLKSRSKHPSKTGVSRRAFVRDHCVEWNHQIQIPHMNIPLRHDGILKPLNMVFVVNQEQGTCVSKIGQVVVNISEFAGTSVSTKYLLEKSKFNSSLQLGISIQRTGGELLFRPPSTVSETCQTPSQPEVQTLDETLFYNDMFLSLGQDIYAKNKAIVDKLFKAN